MTAFSRDMLRDHSRGPFSSAFRNGHVSFLCERLTPCDNSTIANHFSLTISKRIFLLGPSHHHYLTKAALSKCTHYGTPLGNLTVDRETTAELYKTGLFEWMSQSVDEDEHSLEMHLPYIYKMFTKYVERFSNNIRKLIHLDAEPSALAHLHILCLCPS